MSMEYRPIKWYKSVSFKIPMLFITSFIVIIIIIASIVYAGFWTHMIEEYTQMGEGVTNLMTMEIDPDKTDEYIEKNFELDEYNRILERFYALKESYPDVMYMYVYRIKYDGADVVLDLDSEFGMDADAPGDIYELDEPFMEYIDDLTAGREIPPLMGDTPDGYLFTYCRPMFDSDGSYSCHVLVDFSMEKLRRQGVIFSMEVMLFLALAIVLVLLGDIYVIRKGISAPINKIHNALVKFRYETEDDMERNIQLIEDVDIRTNDELEVLHKTLISVMKDSYSNMENLNIARRAIQNKDELIGKIRKTAYQDPLTGVGSKAAYNNAIAVINSGETEFAMMVCDVNDLKYINDTFGHKAGDAYIISCCRVLEEIYSRDHIFRIGGDEFAIILCGDDYDRRAEKYRRVTERFAQTYMQTDKEMWERSSMSVGMAEPSDGAEGLAQVFKRADEAMYANKKEFKKRFGSHRR